ncbi:MAG: carbamoyl phosphate synthase small subunit [Lachnospiraceae bacterium]|nr:carbamoyl phosphate synthase small subunit [Lachnospiraceae bacterium]
MKAFLILEDGSIYSGESIGAQGTTISEIVFNTSMTGYLEILTDPSYAGQAVTMTYPLIGNYGVNYSDMESDKAWPDGFIVRELSRLPSNFRCEATIDTFLKDQNVIGISGIDTRALTKRLREYGTMNGMITTDENEEKLADKAYLDSLLAKIKEYKVTGVVDKVSCKDVKTYVPGELDSTTDGKTNKNVALIDVGTKKNIIRCLLSEGMTVTVYPNTFKADEIIAKNYDGIMISNGPGDPAECVNEIEEIKKLADSNIPIFAICLGHQLMALSQGFKTYKMKYGHRGANHPVKDLDTGRVYISTQNHGYVVDENSFDEAKAVPWFINVNDKTIEGVRYIGKPVKTVQFHPEANAGPKDTGYLFKEFIKLMERGE